MTTHEAKSDTDIFKCHVKPIAEIGFPVRSGSFSCSSALVAQPCWAIADASRRQRRNYKRDRNEVSDCDKGGKELSANLKGTIHQVRDRPVEDALVAVSIIGVFVRRVLCFQKKNNRSQKRLARSAT